MSVVTLSQPIFTAPPAPNFNKPPEKSGDPRLLVVTHDEVNQSWRVQIGDYPPLELRDTRPYGLVCHADDGPDGMGLQLLDQLVSAASIRREIEVLATRPKSVYHNPNFGASVLVFVQQYEDYYRGVVYDAKVPFRLDVYLVDFGQFVSVPCKKAYKMSRSLQQKGPPAALPFSIRLRLSTCQKRDDLCTNQLFTAELCDRMAFIQMLDPFVNNDGQKLLCDLILPFDFQSSSDSVFVVDDQTIGFGRQLPPMRALSYHADVVKQLSTQSESTLPRQLNGFENTSNVSSAPTHFNLSCPCCGGSHRLYECSSRQLIPPRWPFSPSSLAVGGAAMSRSQPPAAWTQPAARSNARPQQPASGAVSSVQLTPSTTPPVFQPAVNPQFFTPTARAPAATTPTQPPPTTAVTRPPATSSTPSQSPLAPVAPLYYPAQADLAAGEVLRAWRVDGGDTSVRQFSVQLERDSGSVERIDEAMQRLQSGDKHLALSSHPAAVEPGAACYAVYQSDGGMYRAKLVSVASEKAKIKFVDYGNEMELPCDRVFLFPTNCESLLRTEPPMAFACRLADFEPTGAAADERFADIVDDAVELEVTFVERDSTWGLYFVRMRLVATDMKDAADLLIQEGLGIRPSPKPDTVSDSASLKSCSRPDSVAGTSTIKHNGDCSSAPQSSLAFANTSQLSAVPRALSAGRPRGISPLRRRAPTNCMPSDLKAALSLGRVPPLRRLPPDTASFTGERCDAADQRFSNPGHFHVLVDSLRQGGEWPPEDAAFDGDFEIDPGTAPIPRDQATVGSLVAAKFEGAYYRAVIVNKMPEGLLLVYFIDFGNADAEVRSHELFPIPAELVNKERTVVVCSLSPVPNSGWTNIQKKKFDKLFPVDEGLRCELRPLGQPDSDGVLPVDLLADGGATSVAHAVAMASDSNES